MTARKHILTNLTNFVLCIDVNCFTHDYIRFLILQCSFLNQGGLCPTTPTPMGIVSGDRGDYVLDGTRGETVWGDYVQGGLCPTLKSATPDVPRKSR